MQTRINRAVLPVCTMLLFLSGCGGGKDSVKTAKVTGTVTYENKPLEGANVTFLVEGAPIAVGTTDSEGKFSIPNVPVGSARVGVSKNVAQPRPAANLTPDDMIKMSKPGKKSMPPPKSAIPVKYADPNTSGFTADVSSDESANSFKFELK